MNATDLSFLKEVFALLITIFRSPSRTNEMRDALAKINELLETRPTEKDEAISIINSPVDTGSIYHKTRYGGKKFG